MAANKFATMLSRNTHRIFVILVYAVLEWVLIMLLLLNSLFSYIITKFAKFFGLAPPCPWCSRVDRILEPGKSTNSYRDLVCETHAADISKLGYCSNHRKLAETQSMCEDCLASRPNHIDDTIGMTHKIALLSWVSENRLENGEKIMRCSCCNESLSRKLYPSYLLFKPSWGDVNYTQKAHLIVEAIEDKKNEGDHIEHEHHDDEGVADEHQIFSDIESFISREVAEDHSSSISNLHYDEKEDKVEKEGGVVIEEEDPCGINNFVCQSSDTTTVQDCFEEDKSLEVMILHSPNYISCDTNRLIPVELIDSSTTANLKSCNLESQSETGTQLCVFLVEAAENAEKTSIEELDIEMNTARVESASVLNFKEGEENLVFEVCGQFVATQRARTFSNDGIHVEVVTKELDDITRATQPQAQELGSSTSDDDDEIPNAFDEFMVQNNISDQPQAQELDSSFPCVQEDQSSTSDDDTETPNAFDEFMAQNNLCTTHIENSSMLEETNLVEKKQEGISHQLINSAEAYGAEEDKLPETPTSLDGFHYLHKKLMLFEKRESAEESLDGSVVSEVEGGDPLLTIERLKATLKAERKILSALYQELEEERSASAIATNQTMAMITRLQEEKAAMQMEALQYQRMMEEQSEYDQEALQLLNELMVKREKEKQEVEKELELYRNKVLDYESKEIEALRRMRDGSERSRDSSSSCSNMGDTEDLSIDLNREARDEDNGFYVHQEEVYNNGTAETVSNIEEMALDCVKHISALDESLAEYEEERLSVLDQLKALEEKLITLGAGEELLEDVNMIQDSSAYSAKDSDENHDFSSPEENGFSYDKHCPTRKTMGSLAKRLLPILDAADNETQESIILEGHVNYESSEMQNSSVSNLELDSKKLAIEEEVDHVYERLQALETDSDFLKNCMNSINKGDKGMDLLQEILQHLRDLKTVELRAKNTGDYPMG